MNTAIDRGTPVGRALADGLLRSYDAWRRGSEAVQRAYDAWVGSDSASRLLSYAGYLAALDQEELAADQYRNDLARVRRMSR